MLGKLLAPKCCNRLWSPPAIPVNVVPGTDVGGGSITLVASGVDRPFVAVSVAVEVVSFTRSLWPLAGRKAVIRALEIPAILAAMTTLRYLVLFKGINVGRAKRIAMADLRRVLGELGYSDVATHLQSGNAVFNADTDAPAVADAVQAGVRTALGVDAAVVVRTAAELAAAMAADPLRDLANDPSRHLLGFFSAAPSVIRLAACREFLGAQQLDPQVAGVQVIAERHCYLWCPSGVSRSPFATLDWDRRLGVVVTMRNWATVSRLAEMLRG